MYIDNKNMGGDPCPGTEKYVDLMYKCAASKFNMCSSCAKSNLNIIVLA